MRNIKKRRFLVWGALAALSMMGACTSADSDGKPLADVTFHHLSSMPLQVSQVLKRDTAGQVMRIDQGFTVPVDAMVESYISSRLQPMGGIEVLFVELEELSVIHSQHESENRVAGFLGVAKIDRYDVTTRFNLVVENPGNGALRGKRFTVRRTINISEHTSVIERERRQQEGIEAMFRDIDVSMMEVLKNEFML